MDGQTLRHSRPCPVVPERFGSRREAELAELQQRIGRDAFPAEVAQEGKPTPAQFENRPPREVLLHDLDASITNAWAWLDLLSKADDNDVVRVQIATDYVIIVGSIQQVQPNSGVGDRVVAAN